MIYLEFSNRKTMKKIRPQIKNMNNGSGVVCKTTKRHSTQLLWVLLLTIAMMGISQAGQITYYTNSETVTFDDCTAGTLLIDPDQNNHYGFSCTERPTAPIYVSDFDSVVWIDEIRLLCRMDLHWRESNTDFNLMIDCREKRVWK